jgi:NAD(P)-dependent dehydrogenase (short-subunit alcohol dehydrogenase family)
MTTTKTALVTGANRGIGHEIARQLAESGHEVWLGSRDEKRGEEAAAKLRANGHKVHVLPLDVTDDASVAEAAKSLAAQTGKLDVLVNNAGISGTFDPDTLSTSAWDRLMDVNAKGVFLGMKHAIPLMEQAGGGAIVNISSVSGFVGQKGIHMAYNASKGAVRLMTKAAAVQYARRGIRVNSVHPGVLPAMRTSKATADPAFREKMLAGVPMGREGRVEEVAYAVLFLASEEASYITGTELVVDGGWLAM